MDDSINKKEAQERREFLQSLDVAADKRQQLKQLFPEAFTEDKVDFDQLKRVLGDWIEPGKERFGLTWPGKAECMRVIQEPSIATLKPVRAESVNFDKTENLFIEGDNLEVLKLLQKSYYGKIKLIYIDPPYNTGKEFIYPDKYSETLETYLEYTGQIDSEGRRFSTNTEAEGRFHSRWLSMMYPRLYLAKNLLREDGVIFISIDDNEIDNLRKICDEIFGEENFIANIIWQHSIQPKGYVDKFSVHHNFLLCYGKSDAFHLAPAERTDEHNRNYANPDNDPRGPWRVGDVRNSLYRPNLRYEIVSPSGHIITPPENGWRWSKETLQQKIDTGEIVFSKDEKRIIRKIYLNTVEGRAPETIWFGKDVGSTRDASAEVKTLFDDSAPFDTPKPTALIKRVLQLSGAFQQDIILDFFAGSATTAHAVMELNKQDGGNRKFILVQLPEPTGREDYKTIADISKERIRRAAQKIREDQEKNSMVNTLLERMEKRNNEGKGEREPYHPHLDLGFKVFKLDRSNFRIWDGKVESDEKLIEQLELHVDHLNKQSSTEDILYELLLKAGFPLTTKIEVITRAQRPVYSVAEGEMLICLEKELTAELIDSIAELEPSRVVFLDEGFKSNDQLKANAVQAFKSRAANREREIVFRTV